MLPSWFIDLLLITVALLLLNINVRKLIKRSIKRRNKQLRKAIKRERKQLLKIAESGVSSLANELGIPLESDQEDEE